MLKKRNKNALIEIENKAKLVDYSYYHRVETNGKITSYLFLIDLNGNVYYFNGKPIPEILLINSYTNNHIDEHPNMLINVDFSLSLNESVIPLIYHGSLFTNNKKSVYLNYPSIDALIKSVQQSLRNKGTPVREFNISQFTILIGKLLSDQDKILNDIKKKHDAKEKQDRVLTRALVDKLSSETKKLYKLLEKRHDIRSMMYLSSPMMSEMIMMAAVMDHSNKHPCDKAVKAIETSIYAAAMLQELSKQSRETNESF